MLSVKAAATQLDPGGERDNVCGTVRRPSPRTVATDRFRAASVLGLSQPGHAGAKGDYRPEPTSRRSCKAVIQQSCKFCSKESSWLEAASGSDFQEIRVDHCRANVRMSQ